MGTWNDPENKVHIVGEKEKREFQKDRIEQRLKALEAKGAAEEKPTPKPTKPEPQDRELQALSLEDLNQMKAYLTRWPKENSGMIQRVKAELKRRGV